MLGVAWSNHAQERSLERFGFDQPTTPTAMLQMMGEIAAVGAHYRLRYHGVTYVCERRPDVVLIITVFPTQPHPDSLQ